MGGGLVHGPRSALSQEWYPHYFVLTSSKIYYSEETSSDQGNEDEEEPKEVRGQPRAGGWAGVRVTECLCCRPPPAGQWQHGAALQ